MNRIPVLQVARTDGDLNNILDKDKALDSLIMTPRIFQGCITETNRSVVIPLDYPPKFLGFRKVNTTDYTHDTMLDNDDIWAYSDGSRGVSVIGSGDDYGLLMNPRGSDVGCSALLFFNQLVGKNESIVYPILHPSLVIGKDGASYNSNPIDLSLDTRFDTMKIKKTGILTLSMPSGDLAIDTTYSTDVVHGLDYPPIFMPKLGMRWNLSIAGLSNDSFVVNEKLGEALINFRTDDYAWYNPNAPLLSAYVDDEKLYLTCLRKAGFITYSAVTITMYYTIFVNKIWEEFNLLEEYIMDEG